MILLDESRVPGIMKHASDEQSSWSDGALDLGSESKETYSSAWLDGWRACVVAFSRRLNYQSMKPESNTGQLQRDFKAFVRLAERVEGLPEPEPTPAPQLPLVAEGEAEEVEDNLAGSAAEFECGV